MSQVHGFSPQMQTTRPDALLHSGRLSKRHAPFSFENRLPQIVTALPDNMATSVEDDQYSILYPESIGPI